MTPPTPNPPRYRWLKRGAVLVGVVLVGLLLMRWAWGHREQAELDRLIADARAKGYPVLFEDLQPAHIPSHENRATHVQQAIVSIPVINARGQQMTSTDWYNEGGRDYFEEHRLPDPVTDNAAYLAQLEPVLEALRKADACTQSDWSFGQPFTRPAINMSLGNLSDVRRLARTLEDAIDRAVAAGEHALAVEMLGLLMAVAESLHDEHYTLMEHLVGISIRALAADAVQRVLPRLPDDPALAGPLASLNARWLDEAWAEDGLAEAMRYELWLIFDFAQGVVDGRYMMSAWGYTPDHLRPLAFGPTRWLLRPFYQDDLAFILAYFTRVIEAAEGCTNRQAFNDRLGPDYDAMLAAFEDASEVWPVRHPLAVEMLWGIFNLGKTHFRFLATARLCATAIAIKRYAIDHGQRPDTLAALVPVYLPAVPDDPFVLGRQITYRPDGASPVATQGTWNYSNPPPLDPEVARRAEQTYPLVYCVGDDGDDDGGLFPIHDYDGTVSRWFAGSDADTDWCFFLTELPAPIPDPQAVPFHQRRHYGSPGLGGPGLRPPTQPGPTPVTPGLPSEEEEVDEADGGGQGDEDEQPPAQPEHGQE